MSWFSFLRQSVLSVVNKHRASSSDKTNDTLPTHITHQMEEADCLIRKGVFEARAWLHWAKPIAMPWCIVLYDDYTRIENFIRQCANEFPIQKFSPQATAANNKATIVLTSQGVVMACPLEWNHDSAQWQELCKWFGNTRRKTYVQRIIIEVPTASNSENNLALSDWAFKQRQMMTSFASATSRFPQTSLLLTHHSVCELYSYQNENTQYNLGVRQETAYTEESVKSDWLAWIKQCERHYAEHAASYDAAKKIQLLRCIQATRDSTENIGTLIRCLAEPNAYHPPVPVIELGTLPNHDKAIAFWWMRTLWPQTQLARNAYGRVKPGQLFVHGAIATIFTMLLGGWMWQSVSGQYHQLTYALFAVKQAQQAGDWLLTATLENTTKLAKAHKALELYTGQLKLTAPVAKAQTLEVAEQIELNLLNRLSQSLVAPNGRYLDNYFLEISQPNFKKRYIQNDSNVDIVYSRLKTYLMLSAQGKADEQFLLAQLPSLWKAALTAGNSNSFDKRTQEAAQHVLELYTAELSNPKRPIYKGNATLIAQTREALRSSKQAVTVAEKVYSDIRAKASAQFPALTLGKIVGEPHSKWLNNRTQIAGAFTKNAYEQFVQPAIFKAGQGMFSTDDWVLGNQDNATSKRPQDTEQLVVDLQNLYQKEFVEQWLALVGQAEWSDAEQAKSLGEMLMALSSSNNSPYLILFKRMVEEASWANGSWVQEQVMKVEHLLPIHDQHTTANITRKIHPLGPHYDVLNAWISSDKNISQSYADLIGKVHQKWGSWIQNAEQSSDIRQDMALIFQNSNSEWGELVAFVEQRMLADMPLAERAIFRELLIKPVTKPIGFASRIVGQDLQAIWQREVWAQWSNLSQRYPFAEEGVDAGLNELAKFFKTKDGTLAKFTDKYLTPFVTNRAGILSPRQWNGVALEFAPGYLAALNRLADFSITNINDAEIAQFELRPIPTPGITDIQLDIDGQVLRYRNGPQSWKTFIWPNASTTSGARIHIQKNGGQTFTAIQHNTRLGLLRLLSQSKTSRDNATTTLSWLLDGYEADDGQLSFQYRHVSGLDPLALQTLKRTSLPQRVIR